MSQETTAVQFDLDDAPDVSPVFTNYGKLTLVQLYKMWKDGSTVEISREQYKSLPERTPDGKGAKQIDMAFNVDLQEFKPSLSFTYSRVVTVDGIDWKRILVPSIEAVFGKGSMSKENRNATLAKMSGQYVSYQDVLQTPTRNKPNPTFNTFKLVKVYATREECLHDASEGFAGTAGSSGNAQSEPQDANVPADYSRVDWLSMKQDVADAVNAAINKATSDTKGKPKPVQAKAIEAAKVAAIATKAEELAATPAQVEWLLTQ